MIPIVMWIGGALACHAVKGDRITAGDLAAVSASFAELVPETVIGYAPQPGARRTFEPAELIRIAQANGLETHDLSTVCFERFVKPLEKSRIMSTLRESLVRPDAEIEVLEFSKYSVPDGTLVFPAETMPAHAVNNVATWNGYVLYDGRHFPVWARVRITVEQTRIVTANSLRAGQSITTGDLHVETVRTFPAQTEPLKDIRDCIRHLARRFMDTGTPVTAADLMEPNDVDRGDTVAVEVQSGSAVLTLEALAEMSGRRGQTIPLRNTTSGKTFRARITGKDKLLLECNSPENYQ